MKLDIFSEMLLEKYMGIGIFYIPLKFLIFNLFVMLTSWLVVDLLYRKSKRKQTIEVKLPSRLVTNIILLSQLVPIVLSSFYIAFKVNIFGGLNVIEVIKFSADLSNFFIIGMFTSISVFLVAIYVLFLPTIRKHIGLGIASIKIKKSFFYTGLGMLIIYLAKLILPSIFYNWDESDLYYQLVETIDLNYFTVLIIIGLLTTPIGEELLFRGIIYNAIKERIGFLSALLLQSIVFSLMHANVVFSFLFAIISAIIYEKTKSLYPSIGLHFLNNSIAYAMIFTDRI